jgi:hypothetical protein
VEQNLLKAEAQYRLNNHAAAAALVNVTRTAAGLNATDANGTNSSCVPRLPDGSCGGLLEMIKWERRMTSSHNASYLMNDDVLRQPSLGRPDAGHLPTAAGALCSG